MSTQQKRQPKIDQEIERGLVKYLRRHPDFFERHTDLLADITLPHARGGAVSLIERQVSVLRDQKNEHKRRLQNLLHLAHNNEVLSERINALILALMDAITLEDILYVTQSRLVEDFDAYAVVMRLFNKDNPLPIARPEIVNWSEAQKALFANIIADRRPVCGQLNATQLETLFNGQAKSISSVALIPLVEYDDNGKCYGLLAIGSHDRQRFRADMGTLFLSYLGKILARIIKPHLT